MHFSLLVVTNQKPDEVTITKLMAPFEEKEAGGEWDWYQVGGRWTGHLDGYEPDKDPANIEVCNLCNGTGKRNDELGQRQRATDPNYTCNGCSGKGNRIAWPTQWAPHSGNSLQVKSLSQPPKPTHAVLKDGEWKDWGWSWDDKAKNEKQKAEFSSFLASLSPDTWLTIVDCHT